jgi:hypothetical protein
MIRPFILTCDKRLDTFRKFVQSYKRIAHSLLQPVLIIDDSNPETREEYHELLLELDPFAAIAQPKYKSLNPGANIQRMMVRDFPKIALQFSDHDALFMEDDILLSSKFPEGITTASRYIQDDADFITLYSASVYGKYDRWPSYGFMHPFNGFDYYGNICVLFSHRVIRDLANNWKKVEGIKAPFDCRWGQYVQKRGYRMYETSVHYAAHQAGRSALNKVVKGFRGARFQP